MDSYTKKFWGLIRTKLGGVADLVAPIARTVKIPLAAGDIAGIRRRAIETKEAGTALAEVGTLMLEVTQDGTLDLEDGAKVVVQLEKLFDELEDIVTGLDEDDVTKPTASTAKKKVAKKK